MDNEEAASPSRLRSAPWRGARESILTGEDLHSLERRPCAGTGPVRTGNSALGFIGDRRGCGGLQPLVATRTGDKRPGRAAEVPPSAVFRGGCRPHRRLFGQTRRGNAAVGAVGPLEAVRTGSKPAKPCPREARQMVEFQFPDNY